MGITHATKIISYQVLNLHTDKIRLLEKFVLLKRFFVDSRIRNYSPKSVSKRKGLKWNPVTVDRWVSRMIAEGWARIEGNDLILISKKELHELSGCKKKPAYIELTSKNKNIVVELYSWSLKNHIQRLSFKKSQDIAHTKIARLKVEKILCGNRHEISSKSLSVLWKVSRSTANRISELIDKSVKFIEKVKHEKIIIDFCSFQSWCNREHWWKFQQHFSSCYWFKGMIFYKPCCEYQYIH
jgi:hypothetical protein